MAVAAYKTFTLWGVIFTFGNRRGNTDMPLSTYIIGIYESSENMVTIFYSLRSSLELIELFFPLTFLGNLLNNEG